MWWPILDCLKLSQRFAHGDMCANVRACVWVSLAERGGHDVLVEVAVVCPVEEIRRRSCPAPHGI